MHHPIRKMLTLTKIHTISLTKLKNIVNIKC
jgi:hypothetical protein